MTKIKLTVTKMHGNEEKPREILFPVDGFSVEDWFGPDRIQVVPNCCKIHWNGQTFRCNKSRADLEAILIDNGVKIIS